MVDVTTQFIVLVRRQIKFEGQKVRGEKVGGEKVGGKLGTWEGSELGRVWKKIYGKFESIISF